MVIPEMAADLGAERVTTGVAQGFQGAAGGQVGQCGQHRSSVVGVAADNGSGPGHRGVGPQQPRLGVLGLVHQRAVEQCP